MDRRKNEAIERTFHDVAGNFSRIFELLVPAGRGELVMQQSNHIESSSSSSSMEVDGNSVSIDRYIGISIKVILNFCACLKKQDEIN